MGHYFKEDKSLDHDIRKKEIIINNQRFQFYTDRGVFSKKQLDFGSELLIKNIEPHENTKTIIDMGCGYGPIGIYLAKTYPETNVYMADINQRAVDLAQNNCKLNQINNGNVLLSDLFEQINFKAELIVTNPPIRAGKAIIFKLYEEAYLHLNSGGLFYCVIQKKQGAPSTFKKLESLFSNCTVIAKNKGYWILLAEKM